MNANASTLACSIATCVSAPRGFAYKGEFVQDVKAGDAMRSSTRLHIVVVGVPSMSECSPARRKGARACLSAASIGVWT